MPIMAGADAHGPAPLLHTAHANSLNPLAGRGRAIHFGTHNDANEELSRAERSGPRRASRATIEPSRPATLGHCPAVGREEASDVTPSSIGDGERGFSL